MECTHVVNRLQSESATVKKRKLWDTKGELVSVIEIENAASLFTSKERIVRKEFRVLLEVEV